MNQYMVGLLIKGDWFSSGNTITKVVFADNETEALKKAKKLAQKEQPEVDHLKIWSWHIEQLSESEARSVLKVI